MIYNYIVITENI